MAINFLKQISFSTVSATAISFSLIGMNPAQAATFSSEIQNNVYAGNTLEFTFEDLNPAIGDVTLSVFAAADLNRGGERIDVSIYSGDSLTDLGDVFDGPSSSWGGVGNRLRMEGMDTLTISESLFNSLGDMFTIQLTPKSSVSNNDSNYDSPSYAYLELDYLEKMTEVETDVEKVPEPGSIAALSLLGLGGLLCQKKRSSVVKES